MDHETGEHIDKEELEKNIEELRAALYEIIIVAKTSEDIKKRLIASELLDKLIVKYMSQNNWQTEETEASQ